MQVSVGSILERSFSATLKNYGVFVVIAVMFNIPAIFITTFVAPRLGAIGSLVDSLSTMVFSSLVTGAVLFGVVQSLRGHKASVSDCVRVATSRLLPIILVGIVYGLGVVFGLILLIVPGIIIACMWYVAVPVTVTEKLGVGESLSRSANLTKGHRMTVFLLVLVFGVINLLFARFVLMPMLVEGEVALPALAGLGLALTLGLWGNAAAAVTYHDLRVNKEGVDTDEIAGIFE